MAIGNSNGSPLMGLDAVLAGQPRDPTLTGIDPSATGVTAPIGNAGQSQPESANEDASPFDGMGVLLESDDATIFKTVDDLVKRQEILAKNRLAQDIHWTYVKQGYPWSKLEKVPDQSIYKTTLPYGAAAISTQAVPNKTLDLVNKCSETLLVDFPQPNPEPLNDSEEAENAAEMAERFLSQDAGESGTNDSVVFYEAVERALTTASTFAHVWVDQTGGGRVPLQIKAHPQAVSPDNPMVGPDGMPTTDYILRYVTAPQGGQFTDDPSQAAPQWQPRLRVDVLHREHVRIYPETTDVAGCEKLIILYYCTVGEAKRRWQVVSEMQDAQINTLCDWQPLRYQVLLPPAQRARWKISNGDPAQKNGTGDERILFYYLIYQRPTPDHPKGATVYVSGANNGLVLDKDLLYADVTVQSSDGSGPKQEPRCLDIPVAQIRPRIDVDDRDPTGICFADMFGGATEFNSMLATSYLEAIDQILHPERYIPSTSPVEGWQVAESRASGSFIPILSPNDKPVFGNPPPIPPNFLEVMTWTNNMTDSIASLSKPAQGSNDQQEVSGVARKVAVQQSLMGLNRMQQAVNSAYERYCRIKIQLAMAKFTTPQQIRYVGEDGAYRVEEWTASNFALVGDVGIQAGTGTSRTPEAKINYVGQLKQLGLLTDEQAADAARPTFSDALGLPDDPHEQYVERCVAAWLKGPPQGWAEQQQQFMQTQAEYQMATQQAQQKHMVAQNAAAIQGADPNTIAPPQLPPPPQAPWTPFQERVNDKEMPIAILWAQRLSKVISSVKYSSADPLWRKILDDRYLSAAQTIASNQPPQAMPKGVSVAVKAGPGDVGQAEQAALHPGQKPAGPPAEPNPEPHALPPAPNQPHPNAQARAA